MATYLPNITDTNLDPVLYTPDYSFLRYALGKKTAQYDQGLKSVSASYNALKADVSDPVNAQRRDEFLKAADSQLQSIASTDLSLQSNVNAANSVFQPLATDKAFIYDSYYTKFNRDQLQKMASWQTSEDPEKRKLFNQNIYEWVNRDLNSLKTAGGDYSKYKVQGRKAFAYQDPQEVINKAAKDMGFEVETSEDKGMYIVDKKGGSGFRKNYEEFAKEVLASNADIQHQYTVLGQNHGEKIVETYKNDMNHPEYANWTNDQILTHYGLNSFTQAKDGQSKYIKTKQDGYDKEKADLNAFLTVNQEKINAGGPEAQEAQQRLAQLQNNANELKGLNSSFTQMFGDEKSTEEMKMKYAQSIASNPQAHYANQFMQNDITRFGNIRSTFGKTTIKENQAYIDAFRLKNESMKLTNEIKNTEFDNELNKAKYDLDVRKQDFEESKALNGGSGTGSGTGSGSGGSGSVPDIQYSDISSTQISKVNALNNLNNKVITSFSSARESLTGAGGALSILTSLGMPAEKTAILRSYFDKHFDNNGMGKGQGTAAEEQAFSSAYTTLLAYARQNGNKDLEKQLVPGGKKLVHDLNWENIFDLAMKNYPDKTMDDVMYKAKWADHKRYLSEATSYATSLTNARNLVVNAVKNDAAFANMIKKKADGSVGLYDREDLSKELNGTGLPQEVKDKIVEGYFDGSLKYSFTKAEGSAAAARDGGSTRSITQFEIGGKKYNVDGFAGLSLSPKDYQKLKNRINDEIPIPNFPADLQAGAWMTLNGKVKQDALATLNSPTQSNSNIYEYASGSSEHKQVDPAVQDAVRRAMTGKDNAADYGVKAITKSPINGGLAIAVTFKDPSTKDERENNPILGRTFYFPISVNERSTENLKLLGSLAEQDEFSTYRKDGKPFVMDQYQGLGMKIVFQPTKPGADDGEIFIYKKAYDDKTKTYASEMDPTPQRLQYNLGARSFTEIRKILEKDILMPYVQNRLKYNQQQQTVSPTNVNNNVAGQMINQLNSIR